MYYVWVFLIFSNLLACRSDSPAGKADQYKQLSTMESNQAEKVKLYASLEQDSSSGQVKIEARLQNEGNKDVWVNKRMAVGYRDSDSREIFVDVFRHGTMEIVGKRAKLYERKPPATTDFDWLKPGASIATSFSLREWYDVPPGKLEVVVYYQSDEFQFSNNEDMLHGVIASDPHVFQLKPR